MTSARSTGAVAASPPAPLCRAVWPGLVPGRPVSRWAVSPPLVFPNGTLPSLVETAAPRCVRRLGVGHRARPVAADHPAGGLCAAAGPVPRARALSPRARRDGAGSRGVRRNGGPLAGPRAPRFPQFPVVVGAPFPQLECPGPRPSGPWRRWGARARSEAGGPGVLGIMAAFTFLLRPRVLHRGAPGTLGRLPGVMVGDRPP